MADAELQVTQDAAAEMALLRRRLARSEAARAEAEALLEVKSRVLAQANEELRANRERLKIELGQKTRQLLEAQRVAGFGTMIWDIDASHGELSPHCQLLMGLSGVAEIGDIRPILARVIPQDRIRVLEWATGLVDRGQLLKPDQGGMATAVSDSAHLPPDDGYSGRMIEFRIMGARDDDPNRMMRVLAEIALDHDRDHVLIFLTLQDITREVQAANEAEALRQQDRRRLQELEQLAAELRLARETADNANSAKTRFLAMMSHDIRTPMNGVIGMLTLFDEGGLSDTQRETLELVRQSSDHLRILLDDIIDLERVELGKLKLNPAPMNSEIFLQGVLGFWGKAARDKGLQFKYERMAFGWPVRAPDWVTADRFRLRQIVDNLCSNAIKYTSEGEITVRMGLVSPERLRFEIVDTGLGIPEEMRSQLFEEFSQLYIEGSNRGGAGLGLAICKRLVTQMGGEIGVTAGPQGTGSCFWVELPWFEAEAPSAGANDAPMILRHPDDRPPRVLVAEDVATNRIVAKGLLNRLGCDVRLVENGAEAVRVVEQEPFDLILMDVSMPVLDGPGAARLIRAMPAPLCDIPIVALTAYSRPEELAPMLNAGAMGTVNKPIVLEDMFRVLHGICCQQHGDG